MNSLRLVTPLASAVVLLASGCGAGSVPKVSVGPSTFTAHGRVVFQGESVDTADNEAMLDMKTGCNEMFQSLVGTQVPVTDPDGKVVGFGRLAQEPTLEPGQGVCYLPWDATDIPATGKVFSYELKGYEPVLFKEAEAADLSIGVQGG